MIHYFYSTILLNVVILTNKINNKLIIPYIT